MFFKNKMTEAQKAAKKKDDALYPTWTWWFVWVGLILAYETHEWWSPLVERLLRMLMG